MLWLPFVSLPNLLGMAGTNDNLTVLLFLFNSTLALLLGISYHNQRRDSAPDLDQPAFGPGELVQISMSSMSLVLLFFL